MFRFFRTRSIQERITTSLERSTRISPELRTAFAAFFDQAHERELFHVNPRYLAERLGSDERTILRLLLAALYEGIVTLHWEVRCPACGGIDHRATSLGELHHDAHCAGCGADFVSHLDEEVRVTFSIHQRLRSLNTSANDTAFRKQIDQRIGATPGLSLLTLPDFQALFPQQRLLPDESLDVTRLALVFTDLAGSTALYARQGDPRAYHLVRLHFDELFRVADQKSGLVVKTIGDAILAVFQTPQAALQAALEMQGAIAELNERNRLNQHEYLILKLGLHCGPCLSVTLNDRPDYFGTTVNIAARVQGISQGNDVVFTDALYRDEQVQAMTHQLSLESNHVALKGIDAPVLVYRAHLAHGR